MAPLEVYVEEPPQGELWEHEPKEISEAITLAYEVFDCVEKDKQLPERFPRELVPQYAEWGKTLSGDEQIEIVRPGVQRVAKVTPGTRGHLMSFGEMPHSGTIEVRGNVLEADVRQRRFQVWRDSNTAISGTFTDAQEELVTSALKDHRSVQVVVRGLADVSPDGKPIRFTEIRELEMLPMGGVQFDPHAPSIEEELARIASSVAASEWSKVPEDLSDQLDHYIYGTPKR